MRLPVREPIGDPSPVPVGVGASGAAEGAPAGPAATAPTPAGWSDRLSPTYLLRSLLAIGAVGILLVGAAPMALAATNPNADPILTEAANGTPNVVDAPASRFTLTDQHGRQRLALLPRRPHRGPHLPRPGVHLGLPADRPGAAVDRPDARRSTADHVELVAVVNNPLYNATAMTAAFDRQEGLDHLANWTYLTGTLDQLHQVWNDYGVQTQVTPAGAMIAHSDIVYIIDRPVISGRSSTPTPGTGSAAGESSFSALLACQVQHVAHS